MNKIMFWAAMAAVIVAFSTPATIAQSVEWDSENNRVIIHDLVEPESGETFKAERSLSPDEIAAAWELIEWNNYDEQDNISEKMGFWATIGTIIGVGVAIKTAPVSLTVLATYVAIGAGTGAGVGAIEYYVYDNYSMDNVINVRIDCSPEVAIPDIKWKWYNYYANTMMFFFNTVTQPGETVTGMTDIPDNYGYTPEARAPRYAGKYKGTILMLTAYYVDHEGDGFGPEYGPLLFEDGSSPGYNSDFYISQGATEHLASKARKFWKTYNGNEDYTYVEQGMTITGSPASLPKPRYDVIFNVSAAASVSVQAQSGHKVTNKMTKFGGEKQTEFLLLPAKDKNLGYKVQLWYEWAEMTWNTDLRNWESIGDEDWEEKSRDGYLIAHREDEWEVDIIEEEKMAVVRDEAAVGGVNMCWLTNRQLDNIQLDYQRLDDDGNPLFINGHPVIIPITHHAEFEKAEFFWTTLTDLSRP